MITLIKRLSGSEVRILLILLLTCDEQFSVTPFESLTDYDITYPTILKVIGILKKKGVIDTIVHGNRNSIVLKGKFQEFSTYLKNFQVQLDIINKDISTDTSKELRSNIFKLIRYYAIKKGVAEDKLEAWVNANYARHYQAAKEILSYVADIQEALMIVDNCKLYCESQRLSWSMQGVMLREIDKFLKMTTNKGADKEWF